MKVGDRASVRSAWLRFPECRLEVLDQAYRRLDRDIYRYESPRDNFVATLKVDPFGRVTHYEGLWIAEETEAH